MAIPTDSKSWTNGRLIDPIEIEAENVLRRRPEKAFTATEITQKLINEEPQVFIEDLRSDQDYAEWGRLVLVTGALERLAWYERVEFREVGDDIYYSNSDGGHYPIADLEDEIPSRFKDIERNAESIEKRLNHLEMRFQEEV